MAGMVRLGGTQPTIVGSDETVNTAKPATLNKEQTIAAFKAIVRKEDPIAAVKAAGWVPANAQAASAPVAAPAASTVAPTSSSTGLIGSALSASPTTPQATTQQATTMAVSNPTITQASNPFSTSSPAPSPAPAPAASTTNTSSTTTAAAPAPQTIAAAMGNAATYNPATRTFDETNGSAAGRVDSILAKGGPLMERARALAVQQSQSRGLINSTMAAEAGTAAMIDRATPLAQQDADAYNKVDSDNQAAQNTAAQYNASEMNRHGLQAADQSFQATQQKDAQSFQNSQLDKTQAFQAQQADTDREIAVERFNVEQENQFKQLAQTHANQMEQLGLQSKLNNSTLPAQQLGSLMQQQQTSIGQILADPNLTPDAKRNAVQNLNDSTNAAVAVLESFYNTPLPRVQTPS